MNFNNYIDKTYIISLKHRTQRRAQTIFELDAQGITNREVFDAIQHENGSVGIMLSQLSVIETAFYSGYKAILIVEDDIKGINNFQKWWSFASGFEFIEEYKYDILYLGCNAHELHEDRTPFAVAHASDIPSTFLKVIDVYGCHAMILTHAGMFKFLQMVKSLAVSKEFKVLSNFIGTNLAIQSTERFKYELPNDVLIRRYLQPVAQCFASYPMIFSQHNGYSDIEKKDMNQDYLERRFKEQTEKLFKDYNSKMSNTAIANTAEDTNVLKLNPAIKAEHERVLSNELYEKLKKFFQAFTQPDGMIGKYSKEQLSYQTTLFIENLFSNIVEAAPCRELVQDMYGLVISWVNHYYGQYGLKDVHPTHKALIERADKYLHGEFEKEQGELKRLYDWLMDDNRQKAITFFTAGELRNVAREIEYKLHNLSK